MTIQVADVRRFFRLFAREPDGEGRPFAQLRSDDQLGAMAVEDMLDDRQAEAGAAARAAFLHADTIETLGQARYVIGGDARAIIGHGDLHPACSIAACGYVDAFACGRV